MTKPRATWVLWVSRRQHHAPNIWIPEMTLTVEGTACSADEYLRDIAKHYAPKWVVLPKGKKPEGAK